MTGKRSWRRKLRYRYRLVAAMLLVSVPLMVVLAIFLTSSASSSLRSSAQGKGLSVARVVTLRLMEQLTDAGRQVSATAQQIAAAGNLADLADLCLYQAKAAGRDRIVTAALPTNS